MPQGSEIDVNVVNEGDLETTAHWHGLRLDNRSDGTDETQAPIPVGGTPSLARGVPRPRRLLVPPGHPEDYGQELGLYGNVLVVPADPDHWSPAHREVPLTLDDVLVGDGAIAPFGRSETTYAAMGGHLEAGPPGVSARIAASPGRPSTSMPANMTTTISM